MASQDTKPSISAPPPDRPTLKERIRRRRKELGRPLPSDEIEPQEHEEETLEEGTVVLHKLFARTITLHPGNIVKKSDKFPRQAEVDALRIAEQARIPVPHVYGVETASSKSIISMSYIDGRPLSESWKQLSDDDKKGICRQLREILATMRSIQAPDAYIGACSGGQIRDTRFYTSHSAPACRSEKEFNEFLLAGLFPRIPSPIRAALSGRLRTDHRIVFTHGDLAPRNIMVRDGRVVGVVDWEEAGWYPEYWEYVKFFQRSTSSEGDWRCFAGDIFPEAYPDELVDYIALTHWQSP